MTGEFIGAEELASELGRDLEWVQDQNRLPGVRRFNPAYIKEAGGSLVEIDRKDLGIWRRAAEGEDYLDRRRGQTVETTA